MLRLTTGARDRKKDAFDRTKQGRQRHTNMPKPQGLKMYTSLARWWPMISAPADYREEAGLFRSILQKHCQPCRSVLELGSGGGNNASHLKKHFDMTLVDVSPGMLKVSQKLNPECEHIRGDMRTVRLGRIFDAVFIHDAVMYMTAPRDLLKAFRTARAHLRPNGSALVVPDHFKENFKAAVELHGHDTRGKGIHYLEWRLDPNPKDTTFESHFVYMIRDGRGRVSIEYDRHVMGLFPKATWIDLLERSGFATTVIPLDHSELEPGTYFALLGRA